ncbi:anthranilate synthase component II, partial [Elusimicrobiota bacterium]
MKAIVIDNYDSFVYNLCDYIGRLGVTDIEVYRNDAISVDDVLKRTPDAIVISPGPGKPQEAGISIELIKVAAPDIPLLGVCLGHQSIAAAFGGNIIRAEKIFHGKTSLINHSEKEIFQGIGNPFEATRYHSLIVDEKGFPRDLEVTAKTDENEIMGIKHKE